MASAEGAGAGSLPQAQAQEVRGHSLLPLLDSAAGAFGAPKAGQGTVELNHGNCFSLRLNIGLLFLDMSLRSEILREREVTNNLRVFRLEFNRCLNYSSWSTKL
jgi:hypothetical protein